MSDAENNREDLQFSNDWFGLTAKRNWNHLLPQIKPEKILEIGSFEGRSTCFLIEKNTWAKKLEIHCVDTWAGGIEHKGQVDMLSVEGRFDRNTSKLIRESSSEVSLVKHKGYSDIILSRLLADGFSGYFDFVYVDGSHQAPDVLLDAIMAFKLVKIGGLIAFDDYTWAENLSGGRDPLRCPKIAIDAFTNIFFRKIGFLNAPISQIYLKKMAD